MPKINFSTELVQVESQNSQMLEDHTDGQVAPEFKSVLKEQAYMVAKGIGNHFIKNKMVTLRELAKDRVRSLGQPVAVVVPELESEWWSCVVQ